MKTIYLPYLMFSITNTKLTERRLEKMAARGWRLDSIGAIFWRYRKCPKARLKYSFAFLPDVSVMDNQPSFSQREFYEYCSAAGWELAACSGPIQVFASENASPSPIDTDEEIKLRAIGRTLRQHYLISSLILLAIMVYWFKDMFDSFKIFPASNISDNTFLATTSVYVVCIVLTLYELAYHFLWYFLSAKSIKKGGKCLPGQGYVAEAITICIALLPIFYLMISRTLETGVPGLLITLFTIFAVLLTIELTAHLRSVLKRRYNRGRVNLITFVVTFAAVVAIVAIGVVSSLLFISGSVPDSTFVADDGEAYPVYNDPLPLTLLELGVEIPDVPYSQETGSSSSPLSDYIWAKHEPVLYDRQAPRINYFVAKIPWEPLRELCLYYQRRPWDLERDIASKYYSADPGPWKALDAWQLRGDPVDGDTLLLMYSDRIVYFDANFYLTDTQRELVINVLSNL